MRRIISIAIVCFCWTAQITYSQPALPSAPQQVQGTSPTDINLSNNSVAENSASGTAIGTFTTVDNNVGDTFTYTLLNNASGRFQVNGDTLKVLNTSLLDFENTSTHQIEVRTTDSTNKSFDKSFTIQLTDANDAPTVANMSVSTDEDYSVSITLSGSDQDPNSLSYTIVSTPEHGSITSFSANSGILTYSPQSNYSGKDSFTYRVNDGLLDSNTGTVTITIASTNDPPSAVSRSVSTNENTTVSFTLSGSDSDGDSITFGIVSSPSNGVLTLFNSFTGDVAYRPNAGFSGNDSFSFITNDGERSSSRATVSITVIRTSPTDTPTATHTNTPTVTPPNTPTSTPRPTSTPSPTDIATHTPTPTSEFSPTPTTTPSHTPTPPPTNTSTATPTLTSPPTNTPTSTPSPTNTPRPGNRAPLISVDPAQNIYARLNESKSISVVVSDDDLDSIMISVLPQNAPVQLINAAQLGGVLFVDYRLKTSSYGDFSFILQAYDGSDRSQTTVRFSVVDELPTPTPSNTVTQTPSLPPPTDTATPLFTNTPTSSQTGTPLPLSTYTPTALPTDSSTPTPTSTHTPVPAGVDSPTPISTLEPTVSITDTPISTYTPVITETPPPLDTSVPTVTPGPVDTGTIIPSPTKTSAPPAPSTSTPTPVIPSGGVIVTDHTASFVDLSGGTDADPPSNKQLVVRWNFTSAQFNIADVKEFHIGVFNASGQFTFLHDTKNNTDRSYVWTGPEFGESYRFIVWPITISGNPRFFGPFRSTSSVAFVQGPETAPTTTPTPSVQVTVTDDTESDADLSGSVDSFDVTGSWELVIRWSIAAGTIPMNDIEDIHIHVSQDGGPYRGLGGTGDNTSTFFVWNNPEPDHTYQFRMYLITRSGTPRFYGPFETSAPVEYKPQGVAVPTPTPSPTPKPTPLPIAVGVSDNSYTSSDLSGSTDYDAPSQKSLTIRWNIGATIGIDPGKVADIHVYVSVDQSDFTYLGRTNNGSAQSFSWTSPGSSFVSPAFRAGPQFGHSYRFMVYVIMSEGELPRVYGPYQQTGSVAYRSWITVTDNLITTSDLSNGQDADPADGRSLVIRFNLDEEGINLSNIADYHIYVSTGGGGFVYLGRTNNGTARSFEWGELTAPSPLVNDAFENGPQFGNSYRFSVYPITQSGDPRFYGPFQNAGAVDYIEE